MAQAFSGLPREAWPPGSRTLLRHLEIHVLGLQVGGLPWAVGQVRGQQCLQCETPWDP